MESRRYGFSSSVTALQVCNFTCPCFFHAFSTRSALASASKYEGGIGKTTTPANKQQVAHVPRQGRQRLWRWLRAFTCILIWTHIQTPTWSNDMITDHNYFFNFGFYNTFLSLTQHLLQVSNNPPLSPNNSNNIAAMHLLLPPPPLLALLKALPQQNSMKKILIGFFIIIVVVNIIFIVLFLPYFFFWAYCYFFIIIFSMYCLPVN